MRMKAKDFMITFSGSLEEVGEFACPVPILRRIHGLDYVFGRYHLLTLHPFPPYFKASIDTLTNLLF